MVRSLLAFASVVQTRVPGYKGPRIGVKLADSKVRNASLTPTETTEVETLGRLLTAPWDEALAFACARSLAMLVAGSRTARTCPS